MQVIKLPHTSTPTVEEAKSIATAMVFARLDYCNSVLYGTSHLNVNKLQRVQNMLACMVIQACKYDHVTPILADLHWLPLEARIRYKIAVMTCNVLNTQQLYYLFELLQLHQPVRQLQSSQHSQLDTNRTCTVFADRAFHNAAPSVWNSLTLYITDNLDSPAGFKSALKIYYYSLYF